MSSDTEEVTQNQNESDSETKVKQDENTSEKSEKDTSDDNRTENEQPSVTPEPQPATENEPQAATENETSETARSGDTQPEGKDDRRKVTDGSGSARKRKGEKSANNDAHHVTFTVTIAQAYHTGENGLHTFA